ncbi:MULTISPECIES: hypothetical protein [Clostridiaceae]|uniref:hypothetical protein n=1 Tax=Clostridiaceae TaxID=31979 RepID=UPI00048784E3|nr:MULTISPECIES: hypothetical protein [Clostridiaceae]
MAKVINFNKQQKQQSSKPDWTPEEIKTKIQPYVDYLNKPNKVFYSKKGDKWTEEENEQFKRLVFKYTVECYSCTAMAEEFKKYYPWRSNNSILAKISDIRQSCYEELEDFYFKVAYCLPITKDAQMHYSAGKIEFGSYLQNRMLQMAGLIEGTELEDENKEDIQIREDNYEKKATWTYIYKKERKYHKKITTQEAAELLEAEIEDINKIIADLSIKELNTKHLLQIALKLDNQVGEIVRIMQDYDEDTLKRRIRAAKAYRQLYCSQTLFR